MVGAAEFRLPDLGEGLEDAELVTWLVAPGDEVVLNQPLASVETAKATVELPSPVEGRVEELCAQPGDTVAVGAVLVRFAGAVPEPAAEPAPGPDPLTQPPAEPPPEPVLVGYGVGERTRAKPKVRRLARELGVDLAGARPGAGPEGTVTEAQVRDAATAAPLRGVRGRMAERMEEVARVPMASASVEVDADALVALRARLAAAAPELHLTPATLVLRAVVVAAAASPWSTAGQPVHLGVAAATERGLVVPVVRDAASLGLRGLAEEVARLTEGARAGRLAPSELVGSTITASNIGALGLDDGRPVVNPPEVAIVAIGAVRQRPWVVDGELAVRHTARLTLTFDHRAADGADAAAFLRTLSAYVRDPELLLLA